MPAARAHLPGGFKVKFGIVGDRFDGVSHIHLVGRDVFFQARDQRDAIPHNVIILNGDIGGIEDDAHAVKRDTGWRVSLAQEMISDFFGGAQTMGDAIKCGQITIPGKLDDIAFIIFDDFTDRQGGILKILNRLFLRNGGEMGAGTNQIGL